MNIVLDTPLSETAEWIAAEVPPALALVEPCTTCGGRGWRMVRSTTTQRGAENCEASLNCRDCIDGRPKFTIEAPCCANAAKCSDQTVQGCAWGSGEGTTTRTFTATELVPVLDRHFNGCFTFKTAPDTHLRPDVRGVLMLWERCGGDWFAGRGAVTVAGLTDATTHALHIIERTES